MTDITSQTIQTAPIPTIVIDTVTADDVINASESVGNVSITGRVGGHFNPNDTVTLSINRLEYKGEVNASGIFTIAVAARELLANPTKIIEASVTTKNAREVLGHAHTVHHYQVDITEPRPTIAVDPITPDNLVNAMEALGSVIISGEVGGDFHAEDTVTLRSNGIHYYGTVTSGGTYRILVAGSDLAADPNHSIEASVATKNKVGNVGHANVIRSYQVNVDLPTPKLILHPITEDNLINAAESLGNVTISGIVSNDFNLGDRVSLTINQMHYSGKVEADGAFALTVPASVLVDNPTKTAHVAIQTYNNAGNLGQAFLSHAYGVNIQTPVLSLEIDNITPDNIINLVESQRDLAVTGHVRGEFNAGDAVTLLINAIHYTGEIDPQGLFRILVTMKDLLENPQKIIKATVVTRNAVGNQGQASILHEYQVDTSTPQIAIQLDPAQITEKNILAAETFGQLPITGRVSGDFTPGDMITLLLNNTSYSGVVSDTGSFRIQIPVNDLVINPTQNLEAQITTHNGVGNAGHASIQQTYTIDISPPTPSIRVYPITADNTINVAESTGPIHITGMVGGDFQLGDVVSIGIHTQQYKGIVAEGGHFSVEVPAHELVENREKCIHVMVETKNLIGITGTANSTHHYAVNLTVPQPVIQVNPITEDNVINIEESKGTLAITGLVTGDFQPEDTVTLVLDQIAHVTYIDQDGYFVFNLAASELINNPQRILAVSMSTQNHAGNIGNATIAHAYEVNLSIPAPIIQIDPITEDNLINVAESTGTILVTGTVRDAFQAHDTVTVQANDQTFTGSVSETGAFQLKVPANDLVANPNKTLQATILTKNIAGNTGSSSTTHTYQVDLRVPKPSILLNAVTPDNLINAAESSGNLALCGVVSGDFTAGDTVHLLVNQTQFSGQIQRSGAFEMMVPANILVENPAKTIEVTVETVNGAGNQGYARISHAYLVNVIIPTPTITVDDITADNIINQAESTEDIVIAGKIGGEFNVGDSITLLCNNNSYKGVVSALGRFSIRVSSHDLLSDSQHHIEVGITTSNPVGNVGHAFTTHAYSVDVEPPKPRITLNPVHINNDLLASQLFFPITGTVTGAFNADDIVTLLLNEQNYLGTVNSAGHFSIHVTGKDLANSSTQIIDANIVTKNAIGNLGRATTSLQYSLDGSSPSESVPSSPQELPPSATPPEKPFAPSEQATNLDIETPETPTSISTTSAPGPVSFASASPLPRQTLERNASFPTQSVIPNASDGSPESQAIPHKAQHDVNETPALAIKEHGIVEQDSILPAWGASLPAEEVDKKKILIIPTKRDDALSDPASPQDPLLACLLWFSSYFQIPCSAVSLAEKLPMVQNKLTPNLFIRAAERVQLAAEINRVPFQDFSAVTLPAVLLLENEEACVLLETKDDVSIIQIISSGSDKVTVPNDLVEKRYLGYAIFIKPLYQLKSQKKTKRKKHPRDWFWSILKRSCPLYGDVLIGSALINVVALALPLFTMNIYDRMGPDDALQTLWMLAGGLGLVFLFDVLLKFIRAYFIDVASKQTDVQLSALIFEQIMGIQMHARAPSVGAFSHNIQSFKSLRNFITSTNINVLVDMPFVFIYLWVIYSLSGNLVFVPLAVLPFLFILGLLIQSPLKQITEQSMRLASEKEAAVIECLTGIESIKRCGAEGIMQARFEKVIFISARLRAKLSLLVNTTMNLSSLTQQLSTVILVILGVFKMINGSLTAGGLIACTILANRALTPIGHVAGIFTGYNQSLESLHNIGKIMNLPTDLKDDMVYKE